METATTLTPRVLFTAPWDPIVVRRGDALGLRAFADQLADAVAPGLSNRVRDGRWVTILAWCLVRSNELFHASGFNSVSTRAAEERRYAWLRPLELMWIARTIAVAQGSDDWKKRSLAGQRKVRPWYEEDFHQRPPRFGMSPDQYQRYRQTGAYGAYRVAFRKWPGLTRGGDGWTPGPKTLELAKWLDQKLGSARPSWPLHADDEEGVSTRSAKRARGNEEDWWLSNWNRYYQAGRNAEFSTLPRRRDDFARLPEADLLEPLVFGKDPSGARRRQVSLEVQRAKATEHIGVCEHLGRVFFKDDAIRLLPHFSRLADAGMEAMDLIAATLGSNAQVPLTKVAANPRAAALCSNLKEAARAWLKHKDASVRHIESADRFAEAAQRARTVDCLRALLQHHELFGGGQRWFVLRSESIEPRMPPQGISSGYRFRLWSLCRLASQCRVLRAMPPALQAESGVEDDDVAEDEDG